MPCRGCAPAPRPSAAEPDAVSRLEADGLQSRVEVLERDDVDPGLRGDRAERLPGSHRPEHRSRRFGPWPGRMAPEIQPLSRDQVERVDVGVERLQFGDRQSSLDRDLRQRVSGSHVPIWRHVRERRMWPRRRPMPAGTAGRIQDKERHRTRYGRKNDWSEKAPNSAPSPGSWRERDHRCGTANVCLSFACNCGASGERFLAPAHICAASRTRTLRQWT